MNKDYFIIPSPKNPYTMFTDTSWPLSYQSHINYWPTHYLNVRFYEDKNQIQFLIQLNYLLLIPDLIEFIIESAERELNCTYSIDKQIRLETQPVFNITWAQIVQDSKQYISQFENTINYIIFAKIQIDFNKYDYNLKNNLILYPII
jgi:hypothetical protein